MIARELRNVTDRYIDLNAIRSYIEKADYWEHPSPDATEVPPNPTIVVSPTGSIAKPIRRTI
jgi:hypothetical protein